MYFILYYIFNFIILFYFSFFLFLFPLFFFPLSLTYPNLPLYPYVRRPVLQLFLSFPHYFIFLFFSYTISLLFFPHVFSIFASSLPFFLPLSSPLLHPNYALPATLTSKDILHTHMTPILFLIFFLFFFTIYFIYFIFLFLKKPIDLSHRSLPLPAMWH